MKGVKELVENDLLWMLEMDDAGEKVERSVEFVDDAAAGSIKEIMMSSCGKK